MLEKESLAVHVLGDMLYNVEGMEKIRAAKGVVLVETADVSPYAEVAREIELSKRRGAGILGGSSCSLYAGKLLLLEIRSLQTLDRRLFIRRRQ